PLRRRRTVGKLTSRAPARLDRPARLVECHRDLGVAELGSPVAVLHHELAPYLRVTMPDVERRAESRAVVAGRRLNEDVPEVRARPDLAVGDAVHCAAAGEAESCPSGRSLDVME